MKKHFTYKSDRQLWRILISETDKLFLETRDTQSKEVFFHYFDLESCKAIISDLQLEEKHWLGVEAIYKDIIYFHKFPKPDLPGHREIIAFDVASQKILWMNTNYSFQFVHQDKVYCFTQGFEERKYFILDYLTGELLDELGSDYTKINELRAEADVAKDWSKYLYPNRLSESDDEIIKKLIESETEKLQLTGDIEFSVYKSLLLFNFHEKNGKDDFTNKFCVIDRESASILFETVLNEKVKSLFTDSFFVYKNILFLLKEKNSLDVYLID